MNSTFTILTTVLYCTAVYVVLTARCSYAFLLPTSQTVGSLQQNLNFICLVTKTYIYVADYELICAFCLLLLVDGLFMGHFCLVVFCPCYHFILDCSIGCCTLYLPSFSQGTVLDTLHILEYKLCLFSFCSQPSNILIIYLNV